MHCVGGITMSPKPSHEAKPKHASGSQKSAKAGEPSGGFPDISKPMRVAISKLAPKSDAARWSALAIFALLLVFLFASVWDKALVLPVVLKLTLTLILLVLGGEIMRGWMGWDGFYGLIMFKDRHTLDWIDRQAQRYAIVWNVLADLGLVLGYGLCGYFLLGKKSRQPAKLVLLYGAGIPLLLLFSLLLSQMAVGIVVGMISQNSPTAVSDISSATSQAKAGLDSLGFLGTALFNGSIAGSPVRLTVFTVLMLVILVAGGLAAVTTLSILAYAAMILPAILFKLGSIIISIVTGVKDSSAPAPAPGGSPIIPGVTIPLFEGILALAIVLVVHEMSHGLLARVSKIRLDSAGVVLFGVLPFGAFVEPDEKELDKVPKAEANRVMVAGVAANLITCLLLFMLMMALLAATTPMRLEGWRVLSGPLPEGAIVYSIDGQPLLPGNNTFAPNSSLSVNTSMGQFVRPTNAQGKIGIQMDYVGAYGEGFKFQYSPGFEWLGFILRTLGLAFALNLLVGMVNLLPIQLADGYRLAENMVGSKLVAQAIGWSVLIAFVINFLPWLFR